MARTSRSFNSRTRVGCDGTPAGLCPPGRSGFNPRTRVGCDVKNLLKFSQKALFQSTHPRGVRLQRHHHPTKGNTGFNPRTRVGCDGAGLGYIPQDEVFQSTHPRGVRLRGVVRIPQDIDVSIHAPAWGATRRNSRNTRPCAGFNPRTRVGCDPGGHGGLGPAGKVSIHAPAWGATSCGWWCSAMWCRFNPRTRVGCDCRQAPAPGSRCRFNPRTRVGCDRASCNVGGSILWVSIHAPAWGATTATLQQHEGGFQFQSTHPRGVRRGAGASCTGAGASFNPRTRVGCDQHIVVIQGRSLQVSIHAPAWGATRNKGQTCGPAGGFQSTHPRGVRPKLTDKQTAFVRVSIHAPAWGATSTGRWPICADSRFQSTHPRGVRHPRQPPGCGPPAGFNPRTRVGCDASGSGALSDKHSFQSTHPRGVRPHGILAKAVPPAVSIHAPAWGATGVLQGPGRLVRVFQSTHPRGVRREGNCARYFRGARFNPRTRVGCDQRPVRVLCAREVQFQSTHPRGVRLVVAILHIHSGDVSIHAPAWGATPRLLVQDICNY